MLTNPPVPIDLCVQALPTSLLCDYEIFANLRLKLYVLPQLPVHDGVHAHLPDHGQHVGGRTGVRGQPRGRGGLPHSQHTAQVIQQ